MRAREFITESPKPMDVPSPDAVDPKSVTDPKQPAQLVNQIADLSNSVKETKKTKRKKK
jgi:hypothetical protein